MGQQQLLLIVLGVIIVGIAVVVGINIFSASSESSAKDAVVSDCTTIGAMAQQYYRKPVAMGGGGNSFVNFAIPTKLVNTPNGSYAASGASATGITITGTPLSASGYSWTVVTTVTPDSLTSAIN
jgi:hypothetical protein